MNAKQSNWIVFASLCRVIGGKDSTALLKANEAGILHNMVEMAQRLDLLPALATRMSEEQKLIKNLDNAQSELLLKELKENTRRNMQAILQAIKLARALNSKGIVPTFLKGTGSLLTVKRSQLGFRKQVDIDLVVAPQELKNACQVLLEAGYGFAGESGGQQRVFHDIERALQTSSHHHHLPPLVNNDFEMSVELHRHYLTRRFERAHPLQHLLDNACIHHEYNAIFKVPSAEHRIIHIILGKFVNDGYYARRDFPVREACDYVDVLQSANNTISKRVLTGPYRAVHATFSELVWKLIGYESIASISGRYDISSRLKVMRKRYDSPLTAYLLDANARATYLAQGMIHTPAKLPNYVRRNLPTRSKQEN